MEAIGHDKARRLVWGCVAAAYAMLAVLLPFSKIEIDWTSLGPLLIMIGGLYAFWLYAYVRAMDRLWDGLDAIAAFILLTPIVLVCSYLAIGLGMPLVDEPLIAMDAALGFDWHRAIAIVDASPWLAWLLGLSYSSFSVQLLAVPVILAIAGQTTRAYAMVFAYVFLCLLISVISIWAPALGAYAHHGILRGDLVHINAHFGYFFLEEFHRLREPGPFVMDFQRAAGILTFPSGHAGIAVVCAWACWSVPMLRYPALLLNVGMCVSAITHGSHYVVDVIAGIGVAGLTIAVASALFYRHEGRSLVVRMAWPLAERGSRPGAIGSPAAASD